MKTFWSVDDVKRELSGGALAIGNFDGVHAGHQALIKKILQLKHGHPAGILTFSPHPQQLLNTEHDLYYLTTDAEKLELLHSLGVDVAIMHKIDERFLEISAMDFVSDILVNRLQIKNVVVGSDFTFGNRALGNVNLLTKMGQAYGFVTHVIDPIFLDGERCSSSAIRQYLRAGDLTRATNMLTRPYFLGGIVQEGQKNGRRLGFRTANIFPVRGFALCNGVYATITRVYDARGYKDFLSATNVGTRPTVTSNSDVVIETHCLDQELDLYDQYIRIFFIERLRDEIKFSTMSALRCHIQQDCDQIRELQQRIPARFKIKDC